MSVPADLVEPVAQAKHDPDLGSPGLEQLALARFIESGQLDRHLRRARLIYRGRRDALVQALAKAVPAARVRGVAAGLHAVVGLPAGVEEDAVVAAADRRAIRV